MKAYGVDHNKKGKQTNYQGCGQGLKRHVALSEEKGCTSWSNQGLEMGQPNLKFDLAGKIKPRQLLGVTQAFFPWNRFHENDFTKKYCPNPSLIKAYGGEKRRKKRP